MRKIHSPLLFLFRERERRQRHLCVCVGGYTQGTSESVELEL